MNCSKNGIKIEGSSCSYNNKCIYPKCITDMNKEYVIIDKSLLEKRIEELENELISEFSTGRRLWVNSAIKNLKEVLSQSTPLIPEIDAAIQFGKDVRLSNTFINTYDHNTPFIDYYDTTTETCQYISNLKLDI